MTCGPLECLKFVLARTERWCEHETWNCPRFLYDPYSRNTGFLGSRFLFCMETVNLLTSAVLAPFAISIFFYLLGMEIFQSCYLPPSWSQNLSTFFYPFFRFGISSCASFPPLWRPSHGTDWPFQNPITQRIETNKIKSFCNFWRLT